jgi:hypothetical protein
MAAKGQRASEIEVNFMVTRSKSVVSIDRNHSERCLPLSPPSLAQAYEIRGSHFRTKHTSRGIQQRRHGDADHWIARSLAQSHLEDQRGQHRQCGSIRRAPSPPHVYKVITPSAYTMFTTGDVRRQASISKRFPVLIASTS